MGYELLEKTRIGFHGLPNHTISISKASVRLSNDMTKYFEHYSHCEVYIDRENLRIGLKPSNDMEKGFKITVAKGKYSEKVYLSVSFLRKGIAFGHYPLTVDNDGILSFKVKEIAKQ